jgi:hypothetical protein
MQFHCIIVIKCKNETKFLSRKIPITCASIFVVMFYFHVLFAYFFFGMSIEIRKMFNHLSLKLLEIIFKIPSSTSQKRTPRLHSIIKPNGLMLIMTIISVYPDNHSRNHVHTVCGLNAGFLNIKAVS